jgi:diguanylate cyclase (GGDEF)-like protein
LDVDNFKILNDRCGHPAADQALVAAGRALRQCLRGGDLVARIGGDEFGLLLQDVQPENAVPVVERLRAIVGKALSETSGSPVTASAGLAVGSASRVTALVPIADQALREAKNAGRDRTMLAAPPPRAGSH